MSKVYVLTHYEEDSPSKPEYTDTVLQHSYYVIDTVFEARKAAIKRLHEIIKEWRNHPNYEANCVEEYFSIREGWPSKFEFTFIDGRYCEQHCYEVTEKEVK